MADAVQRLWPGTPIDAGRQDHSEKYQYDFRFPRAFKPEDFEAIEKKMDEIIAENLPFERTEHDRDEVREVMNGRGEDIKLVRLDDIPEGETISLYRHGDFVDLCRGPHVQRTGQIGAVRLLEASGAYFKGDERNEMLQRIYGTAFASKKAMKAYFDRLEEIKKRDHRRLGKELDLFSFHQVAPASPFFHPRGAMIYNMLIELMREKYREYGYSEVITPQIFDVSLWKQSGHYDNYREEMYFADSFDEVDERSNSAKPMNCPSHCVLFGASAHSYRDLPIRIADFGRLHRYERSGVITGLTRGALVLPGRRPHLLYARTDRVRDHQPVQSHLRDLRAVRVHRHRHLPVDPTGEGHRRPRPSGITPRASSRAVSRRATWTSRSIPATAPSTAPRSTSRCATPWVASGSWRPSS
jgi:threonyl-tRNA synthetase